MTKFRFVYAVIFAFLAFKCRASTYNVGDSSGWDISTDLDTWEHGKTFVVGDVLSFQYSSNHNVSEATKENYERCNTTNVLQNYTGGNTTITLSSPGDKYFICSNRLHCFGGMKLHVHVAEDQTVAPSPSPGAIQAQPGAPQGQPGAPQAQPGGSHSSKTKYYSSSVPSLISYNFSVMGLFGLLLLVL